MKLFDAVCPFDGRYYGTDEEFYNRTRPYLSEEAQIAYQIRVEIALLKAFADFGFLSRELLDKAVPELLKIPPAEVYAEEEITQHNVRALINCMKKRLDPKTGAFVHLTATSCDITDTARALCLKEYTLEVLVPEAVALERELVVVARRNAGLVQIGRTHGQHAIPTTFGNAVALYVSRLGGRIITLHQAACNLRGKVAGAVGVYSAQSLVFPENPAALEAKVLKSLGLMSPPTHMASQIVEPEFVTDLGYGAVSLFSVLANLADDFRHLMRTEIGELGKKTLAGHVGSSTMPHKVNPKDFENVKSLWKAYMPRIITLLSDQISEHQRDLTNSASGRYVQELLAAVAYSLRRTRKALSSIRVQGDKIKANLDASKHTFIAEPLYIVLSAAGISNGYEIMKNAASQAREGKTTVAALLTSDPKLKDILDKLPEGPKKALQGLLESPEKYNGMAEKAALETCDHWEKEMTALEKALPS